MPFMSLIILLISTIPLSLSFILFKNSIFISMEIPLILLNNTSIPISILLDWMSTLFLFSVLFISSMILIFSYYYIPHKEQNQFMLLMLMFILSMNLLILSDNLIFIMLGWDGLGLSSYVLVIYYQNPNSLGSGWITILSNRVGDILIILSIAMLISSNNWNFTMNQNFPLITLILLTTAAFTKSAQFPFSAWLPAAMAAPTPISALVHSSTLVTAGVFLLIRLLNFPNSYCMTLIMTISSLTTMFASISANWEQDMKKIIALSTLSQIALMMFAISLNSINMAFFHLITHAYFKSTMFLCAGIFIHSTSYQDMRKIPHSPLSSFLCLLTMGITSLSLMGMPFLSGFFSKDTIMDTMISSKMTTWMSILMIFSIGLTSSYSLRMISSSTKTQSPKLPMSSSHLSTSSTLPLLIMTPMSIFMGSFILWIQAPLQSIIIPNEFKFLIIIIIMLGMLMGTTMSFNKKLFIKLNEPSLSLWFSNFISTFPFLKLNSQSFLILMNDKSWQEIYGPQGSYSTLSLNSSFPDLLLNSSLLFLLMIMISPMMIFLI